MKTMIEVKDLTKVYGNGDIAVKALNGVSFTIEKGEFVSICGPSGSGKSTLLHIIGGLDNITSGEILIDGVRIDKLNDKELSKFRRKNSGFIFQAYNLIPVLTVEENIMMPLLLDGKKPDQAHANEIIDLLGLKDRINHLPNQLSGGQQQRTAIARALINKPAVVFADEPTGNLDTKNGNMVMDILQKSNKVFNQTIVMITHDMQIASLSDRIIRIEDGQIVNI